MYRIDSQPPAVPYLRGSGAAALYSSLLWTGLNRIIAWESREFGTEVKFHVIGDGDFAGLLIADRVHVKNGALGGDAVDAWRSGSKRPTLFSRSFENSFFPGDEDITVATITCV